MKTKCWMGGVILLVLLGPAWGQTPRGQFQRGFWRVELPKGIYMVALNNVSSIAMHEYIVDKSARVTELTISTIGTSEGRFYFVEPYVPNPSGPGASSAQELLDKAQQRAKEAADRIGVGDALSSEVIKNYPATTHAHTVEYRLESKEQVKKLFESVEAAVRKNADTTLNPNSDGTSGTK